MKARLVLGALLLWSGLLQAQKVRLRMNLEKGTVFYQSIAANQELEAQSVKIPQTFTIVYKGEVMDRNADSSLLLKLTYTSIRMKQENPMMGTQEYDSRKPDSASTVLRFWNELLNKHFTVKMQPNGEITDIVEMSIDNIPKEKLLSNIRNNISTLPDQPVGVGDTWQSEAAQTDQHIKLLNTYKVTGRQNGITSVAVQSKVINDTDNTDAGSQTGTMDIDEATGLVTQSNLKQVFKMTTSGMQVNLNGTLTITTGKNMPE